jgi:hypothetical protein
MIPGQVFLGLSMMFFGSVWLYAIWKKNRYVKSEVDHGKV